jgi:hypothetical protein
MDGNNTGQTMQWVMPGEEVEAAPPSPAEVATTLLAEARARMLAPRVNADPPLDSAAIITLPVFVEVTNWVDAFSVPGCVGPVCVEISATPTLFFNPGEPGSTPIECDPPGTRFDRAGADPAVQAAAPGACAYEYQMRTGTAGRPDAWPGEVIVTWDVSWTSNTGAGDSFPPQSLSTSVPRAVDEVQTVVVDRAGG